MIDIDTARLQELMAKLQQANTEIDSACNTLLSITTHDGWACRERHVINEYILENRANIQKLRDRSNNFAHVAKAVVDEFVDTEVKIPSLFNSVESALASIIATPISKVNVVPVNEILRTPYTTDTNYGRIERERIIQDNIEVISSIAKNPKGSISDVLQDLDPIKVVAVSNLELK